MNALLTSLNLAVQHGIDPDPDNAVAVATFAYQDAAGNPQQVWPSCQSVASLQFALMAVLPIIFRATYPG